MVTFGTPWHHRDFRSTPLPNRCERAGCSTLLPLCFLWFRLSEYLRTDSVSAAPDFIRCVVYIGV